MCGLTRVPKRPQAGYKTPLEASFLDDLAQFQHHHAILGAIIQFALEVSLDTPRWIRFLSLVVLVAWFLSVSRFAMDSLATAEAIGRARMTLAPSRGTPSGCEDNSKFSKGSSMELGVHQGHPASETQWMSV